MPESFLVLRQSKSGTKSKRHHVYVQEETHHEMDYEFLPKRLPLSDLFFGFVFLVEPYTWGLPPRRFLSHHIIPVSIHSEGQCCLKPGLIFSTLWQRPLSCGYGAAHTLYRELGWPWNTARQSSSSNGRFIFREVLALACRVLCGYVGGGVAWYKDR